MNKKNILISVGFVTILLAFLTMNILKEDEKISYAERRRLMQFPNISVDNIEAQCYYGKILDNGIVENVSIIPMKLTAKDEENKIYGSCTCHRTTVGRL